MAVILVQEAKAGRLQVQGQSELPSMTLKLDNFIKSYNIY